MRFTIFISILLFSIEPSNGQEKQFFYIWAQPGLSVRSTSDPESQIKGFIPYGEKVEILNGVGKSFKLELIQSFLAQNEHSPIKGEMSPTYEVSGSTRPI